MKLGERLKQLESMVTFPYDHIWDCCCDHGLLGAALLSRKAAPHIHFVDIVPELMVQLESKLTRFFPKNSDVISNSQWQVHCVDVADLPLRKFDGKHLIIIAGVGGELMAEFVNAIYQNYSSDEFDLLLCPVNDPFLLRQQLIQLNFGLLTEKLIIENRRYYEALLVSNTSDSQHPKISNAGDLLWKVSSSEQLAHAKQYLKNTLAHHRRKQLSSGVGVQPTVDAYGRIVLK